MKTCTKCKQSKPLSEFWLDRSKKNGHMARCRTCKTVDLVTWRKANPEKQKNDNKKRYWDNRDKERERHLVSKYGITFIDYARILKFQEGKCAVCGKLEDKNRTFDVDHDHVTGAVRGLLCTSCNRMIGHSGDSAKNLISAARYLQAGFDFRPKGEFNGKL